MNKKLVKPMRGVVPPMITPLVDEYNLDLPGLKKLIEHILAGGVHGLFLLGTTGEGPSLSNKLKYEMVKKSCEIIAGRVPVLVGISDTSFAESISLAEHAAECGADAVVLAPPYYFPAGQAELLEYFEHLAPKLALPIFLYNMPSMTKVTIDVDTLQKASEIDNIIGFKDSGGNMIKYHEYINAMRDKPDFSMLIGPEELFGESVLFGGHGGVVAGANIKPRLFVDMYEAAVAGDLDKIKKLHQEIFVFRQLYLCGQYTSSFIKGVKCSLNCMGICSDFMAEPFHAFREPERNKIEALLHKIKLLD
jgi:4-hydroxy-tetrahydrodipicolinate synthase